MKPFPTVRAAANWAQAAANGECSIVGPFHVLHTLRPRYGTGFTVSGETIRSRYFSVGVIWNAAHTRPLRWADVLPAVTA